MAGGRHPFHVIEGALSGKPKRKTKARTKRIWECRVCLVDVGVTTKTLMKAKFGAEEAGDLKMSGGRDAWVCVHCLARGKVTYSDR